MLVVRRHYRVSIARFLSSKLVYHLSAALWITYLIMAASWRPDWIPDLNPIRRFTGYQCPLTGLTRSVYAAAHGDLIRAFELNPMFPAYILILIYAIALFIRLGAGKVESPSPKPVMLAIVVTMVMTVVVRLVAGLPMRVP